MIRILYLSTGPAPCLKCGSTQNTAVVKGEDFSAVLCMEHAWGLVPVQPKMKEVKRGQEPEKT